jgi:hypothetical protein
MAVWHDVDTLGYVEGEDGIFRPEVLLPGIDRTRVPSVISPTSLPLDIDSTRVMEVDGESLGMRGAEAVHVARLAAISGARAWSARLEWSDRSGSRVAAARVPDAARAVARAHGRGIRGARRHRDVDRIDRR